MHDFTELIDKCATFTLNTLREANERTLEELETSGATSLVKTLQMIRLQKTILAVGMFSIFEASLQNGLNCSNGFVEAKKILEDEGELDTKMRFDDLYRAVNALKHGRGISYHALIAKADKLNFMVKLPNESFFDEGDVSEVSTLIDVNDEFVRRCSEIIRDISAVILRVRPEFAPSSPRRKLHTGLPSWMSYGNEKAAPSGAAFLLA